MRIIKEVELKKVILEHLEFGATVDDVNYEDAWRLCFDWNLNEKSVRVASVIVTEENFNRNTIEESYRKSIEYIIELCKEKEECEKEEYCLCITNSNNKLKQALENLGF